jgi:hypothetical protein
MMQKMRMELDELQVETFEAGEALARKGTVAGLEVGCSQARTCGIASRGEETFEKYAATLYVCCV